MPKNVVYKMLEKYYYFDMIFKLKKIIGPDKKLSDKEAKKITKAVSENAGFDYKFMKKNKMKLEPEEREEAMKADACWHHGPGGTKSCAIWKTKTKSGQTKYCCNTHRAAAIKDTLKAAIKAFDFIKTTS